MQIAEIVELVPHSADAVEDPLVERIFRIVPGVNLRVPHRRQAFFERGVDVVGGDQFLANVLGRNMPVSFPFGGVRPT